MAKCNIYYEYAGECRVYCKDNMDFATAQRMLALWIKRYWDEVTDTPKAYPNGKGFYPVTKARIFKVGKGN